MFWTKEESIPQIQRELEQRVRSFEEAVALIQNIPSIQEVAAAAIVAEIGVDMDHSPMASHLASWAGVCPGNRQSGGKLLSGATTAGNAYLRAILEEVAQTISHMKDNDLSALYHRLVRRRGKQQAIVAVSHSVLVIIYHMSRDKKPYTHLGADYFDKLDSAHIERHHVRHLEQLGDTVTLTPTQVA